MVFDVAPSAGYGMLLLCCSWLPLGSCLGAKGGGQGSIDIFFFLLFVCGPCLLTSLPPACLLRAGQCCVAPPQNSAPEHSIIDGPPDLKMDPPLLD